MDGFNWESHCFGWEWRVTAVTSNNSKILVHITLLTFGFLRKGIESIAGFLFKKCNLKTFALIVLFCKQQFHFFQYHHDIFQNNLQMVKIKIVSCCFWSVLLKLFCVNQIPRWRKMGHRSKLRKEELCDIKVKVSCLRGECDHFLIEANVACDRSCCYGLERNFRMGWNVFVADLGLLDYCGNFAQMSSLFCVTSPIFWKVIESLSYCYNFFCFKLDTRRNCWVRVKIAHRKTNLQLKYS